MKALERGDRVSVVVHDWERGSETHRGDVRRMLSRDRVEVDLDAGANPDDPDERLTVITPTGDVTALDAQAERRAA